MQVSNQLKPHTNPVLNNPQKKQKKHQLLSLIFILLIILGLVFWRLWRVNKISKLTQNVTPDNIVPNQEVLIASDIVLKKDGLPIVSMGPEAGYFLTCQIFSQELNFPMTKMGDFIIHSSIPCHYYNENGQALFIEIPILVENTAKQTYAMLGSHNFLAIPAENKLANLAKNLSSSVFAVVEKNNQLSEKNSVLVDLYFAINEPYEEGFYDTDGIYRLRNEDDVEIFFRPLVEEHQNPAAIEFFINNQQWNNQLDQYLLYNYATIRPIQ